MLSLWPPAKVKGYMSMMPIDMAGMTDFGWKLAHNLQHYPFVFCHARDMDRWTDGWMDNNQPTSHNINPYPTHMNQICLWTLNKKGTLNFFLNGCTHINLTLDQQMLTISYSSHYYHTSLRPHYYQTIKNVFAGQCTLTLNKFQDHSNGIKVFRLLKTLQVTFDQNYFRNTKVQYCCHCYCWCQTKKR